MEVQVCALIFGKFSRILEILMSRSNHSYLINNWRKSHLHFKRFSFTLRKSSSRQIWEKGTLLTDLRKSSYWQIWEKRTLLTGLRKSRYWQIWEHICPSCHMIGIRSNLSARSSADSESWAGWGTLPKYVRTGCEMASQKRSGARSTRS